MEAFLTFFELMPTWQKAAWIFVCLSFGWVLQRARPLVRFEHRSWAHARLNLLLLGMTLVINTVFTSATLGVFAWVTTNRWGLLHAIELPIVVELILALALFDLIAQYGVHVLLHKVPFLWRLHIVHHSDEHVDVTTGTRHHPLDYVMREAFALIAVIVVGAPLAFYLIYRLLTVFFTYATHANIDVPQWLDRPLSYVFVTPTVHKFHHHAVMPWTDTNYGNILSIWDRLFGTLVYEDVRRVRYGLDVVPAGRDDDISYQLAIPFNGSVQGR